MVRAPEESDGGMIKIATIIPYYQREPGILRRALASIYAQALGPDRQVEVIVVDDASPSPPDLDLTDSPPPQFSLRVIRRENGGPGAARNTGLDAVGADTDFIAFLDSDDSWVPDHLERALATLGEDGDFYFCDQRDAIQSQQWVLATRFQALCAQDEEFQHCGLPRVIAAPQKSDSILTACDVNGSYRFMRREGLTSLLRTFLAHISATVIRNKTLGHIRFDRALESSGEDYLYFLMLANIAKDIRYSKHCGVNRGVGVSMFQSMLSWDNPASIKIIVDALRVFILARAILDLDENQKRILDKRISFRRLEATARVLADLRKLKRPAISSLVKADRAIIWRLPIITIQAVLRKLLAKPISEYLRTSEIC
jgi:succinoglycan biosynthesis protein ExoW